MKKKRRNAHSLKDRFNYWFDNRIAKSSLGFIRILIIASVLLALVIAGLIVLVHLNGNEQNAFSVFWNSIATVINAQMPYAEEGGGGYLILMSVTAIAGVLFTSVLIGIITNAIEEKIIDLKKGNSFVLEKDHIVVLGFKRGEYTLLNQLILAAEGRPACVVLADDMEREEMEDLLEENLEVPDNFRFVCRTADITDPNSIEKCSIETCRTVIISPTDDAVAVKAILAVSALMQAKGISDVRVNAIITKNKYHFPQSLEESHSITALQTNSILAKMIAHSCTQMGLSETFRELFNFEGSEFYLIDLPEVVGETFEELTARVNHAVPLGIFRDDRPIINPPADLRIEEGDRILVFAEESTSARLEEKIELEKLDVSGIRMINSEEKTDTVIIGHNETLPIVLRELPENVSTVHLAGPGMTPREQEILERVAAKRDLKINYYDRNIRSDEALLELAQTAEHVVILSDHDKEDEEADLEVIFLLLNFRDLRKKHGLTYNITVEMQTEHNQKLVGMGDYTDFLVASSMSSLLLAQLAESPELIDVFRELLSNKGNELYLKNVARSHLTGTHTVRDLRRIALKKNYVLLGYIDAEKKSYFNLPLDQELTLHPEDDLIVLGYN